MIAVLVLDHVEGFDLPACRARRHDRYLALERHESFQDLRLSAKLAEQRRRIAAVADHRLALAVIAKPPCLQHGRPPDRRQRGGEHVWRIHRGEIRGADAERLHELLFDQPILRRRQHLRIGQHGLACREEGRGFGRHVFELVGHDIDIGGKTVERGHVEIIGFGDAPHDLKCRRVRIRTQHMALETEPCCRKCEHAAELSAAEDADRGVAAERPALCDHALSSGVSATASVCCLRHASSRAESAASESASTAAASNAALMAPALPIASVPTGTPGGICTIE